MIKKYHKQYNNLKIKINNSFHDRFIIIDRKVLYHSGASFKDLGEKCFATNLIDDKTLLYDLMCATKFLKIDQRLNDIIKRHGIHANTQYHIAETMKLKKYFDDLLGYNLYDLFSEAKDNL